MENYLCKGLLLFLLLLEQFLERRGLGCHLEADLFVESIKEKRRKSAKLIKNKQFEKIGIQNGDGAGLTVAMGHWDCGRASNALRIGVNALKE